MILFIFLSSPITGCQGIGDKKGEAGAVFTYDSHVLSQADMTEDYNTMWKIIEDNYPYMGVAERTTKKNFKEVKSAYYSKLKDVKNDEEFGELVEACLKEFEGCGHMLMLNSDTAYANYMKLFEKADYGHCKVIYDTMNNKASRNYYSYKPDVSENIGEEAEDKPAKPVSFEKKVYDDVSTAYIKIPSFSSDNIESGVPALDEFFRSKSGMENCIIDIRGNGGGSDRFWNRGIVELNLKKDLACTYYMLTRGSISERYVESDIRPIPIEKLDVSSMPELNARDFADMDHYVNFDIRWDMLHAPAFKGNFYVLIDNKNYSSAESFVDFCKATGFAALVGASTGGDGMGIDPMISVLPKSGICFRFSVLYGLNPDGGSNEEFGTAPDIPDNGEDALEVCLRYIREKN